MYELLREAGFTLNTYTWTGSNSFRARNAASLDLADELRDISENSPDADIVLIAHSHGGNVALNAIANSDVRIAGLVAMATPFSRAICR